MNASLQKKQLWYLQQRPETNRWIMSQNSELKISFRLTELLQNTGPSYNLMAAFQSEAYSQYLHHFVIGVIFKFWFKLYKCLTRSSLGVVTKFMRLLKCSFQYICVFSSLTFGHSASVHTRTFDVKNYFMWKLWDMWKVSGTQSDTCNIERSGLSCLKDHTSYQTNNTRGSNSQVIFWYLPPI